jgi:acetyl-CoA carboxylase biotin carboxyl carrier protein
MFELERDGFKLKLVKHTTGGPTLKLAAGSGESSALSLEPLTAAPAGGEAAPLAAPHQAPGENGLVEMRSPIVGTVYRSPRPEAPAFVEVGARVKPGQVMCIVEAMKVMNEIECEIDAEVVEVLVANGQPVEFGEVLFRLRPAS